MKNAKRLLSLLLVLCMVLSIVPASISAAPGEDEAPVESEMQQAVNEDQIEAVPDSPNADTVYVTVAKGATYTVSNAQGSLTNGGSGSSDHSSYAVSVTPPTGEWKQAEPVNNAQYIVGNGTNFISLAGSLSDSSISNTTNKENATKFTVTASGDSWTIMQGTNYLQWGGRYNTTLQIGDSASYWTINSNGISANNNFIRYSLLGWTLGTNANYRAQLYQYVETPGSQSITFTGTSVGVDTYTIGDVTYEVKVIPSENEKLTLNYRITNFEIIGKGTVDPESYLPDDYTDEYNVYVDSRPNHMTISASKVYSAEGASIYDLLAEKKVPGYSDVKHSDVYGVWKWGERDSVYWKAVYLTGGKKQDGTGNKDDYTTSGKDFQYIRYSDSGWQVRDRDEENWTTVTVDDTTQFVAYYLMETDVTTGIETRIVDWGYTRDHNGFKNENNDLNDGYALVDYDVHYPTGVRAPLAFPNEHTFAFHVLNNEPTVAVPNPGTTVSAGQDGAIRRVGMSLGVNSNDYEIYMITVTRTSDTVTDKLTADSTTPGDNLTNLGWTNVGFGTEKTKTDFYKGTEYVAWALTEQDYLNSGLPPVHGFEGHPEYATNNTHYDAWANTVATDLHFGGDPYVSQVYIPKNQGVRITFWVRATSNGPHLTVNYIDLNTEASGSGDASGSIFHSFYIPLEETEVGSDVLEQFPEAIRNQLGQNNKVTYQEVLTLLARDDTTITDRVHIIHKLEADLTKLANTIPGNYSIPNAYNFIHAELSEDGKTLNFYYRAQFERIFVSDFGVPLQVTVSKVGIGANADSVVNASSLAYIDGITLLPTVFDKNGTDSLETGSAEITLNYGTVKVKEGYSEGLTASKDKELALYSELFTYYPTSPMNGPEAFTVVLRVKIPTDNTGVHFRYSNVPISIGIIPATTVHYEEGFATYTGWTGDMDPASYYSKFQEPESPGKLRVWSYGYDPIYANNTAASFGTEMKSTTAGDSAVFTFRGTGVDLLVNTTPASGALMAVLRNSKNEVVRVCAVDTHMENGSQGVTAGQNVNGYGIPVVSLMGYPLDTYTLTVTHVAQLKNGQYVTNPVAIDGFRVYNPAANDEKIYDSTVGAEYAKDGEKDPAFVEFRDAAIAAANVVESYDGIYKDDLGGQVLNAVPGTASIIIVNTEGTSSTGDISNNAVSVDLISNGPKNELYLQKGQTVAFSLASGVTGMDIGMKVLGGTATTVKGNFYASNAEGVEKVNGMSSDNGVTISSGTDMFYHISSSTVAITNTGDSVLAITKIKTRSSEGTTNGGLRPLDQNTVNAALRAAGLLPAVPFSDVRENAWYTNAVRYVYDMGIMQGTAADTFAPNGIMTRAEMVTVLYRMAGSPAVDTAARFEDVRLGAWYSDAIAWAVENGITKGISAARFDPKGNVTREQMVVFLSRYAAMNSWDMSASDDLSTFGDTDKLSTWSVDAFSWAVAKGIIQGSGSMLMPKTDTSRAQIAQVIFNFQVQ